MTEYECVFSGAEYIVTGHSTSAHYSGSTYVRGYLTIEIGTVLPGKSVLQGRLKR